MNCNNVETNTYRYSLSTTSQFFFCGVPFRLDTTARCRYDCLYCFARSRGGRGSGNELVADPGSIERRFLRTLVNKRTNGVLDQMIEHRMPLHFGGISDPFSSSEVIAVSNRLLRIMSDFDYPVVLSTKNPQALLRDDTVSIISGMRKIAVQVTISSLYEKQQRIIEPSLPLNKERMHSLKELSKMGIFTTGRIQPLFYENVDYVSNEIVPALVEADVKHVILEFLKLPVESKHSMIGELFTSLNWNGYEKYCSLGARLYGREWMLPPERKWELIQPIIKAIRKGDMTYGAGDYGLNHLGDTSCCCGIDRMLGFEGWFKGNIAYAIRSRNGSILRIDDLCNQYFPEGSIRMYLNSNCRDVSCSSLSDYIVKKWNRPGTVNAPDAFLGVKWSGEYDDKNCCIYTCSGV